MFQTRLGAPERTVTDALDETSTNAAVTGFMSQAPYLFKLVVEGGIHAGDSNIVSVTTGAV